MTSDKARTNKKWTSTEDYKDNYDRIFSKKECCGEGCCDNQSKPLVFSYVIKPEDVGSTLYTIQPCGFKAVKELDPEEVDGSAVFIVGAKP